MMPRTARKRFAVWRLLGKPAFSDMCDFRTVLLVLLEHPAYEAGLGGDESTVSWVFANFTAGGGSHRFAAFQCHN